MVHPSSITTTPNSTLRQGPSGFYKGEYHTVLLILALAIIVHNSIVLYLYRKQRFLRNETNLALASTACADLLTGLILIPFLVCSAVLGGRAPQLNPLYFTSNVISDFVTIAIVLNLLLVTGERYTALCHPYFYEGAVTKSLIWRFIYGVWIVSLLVAVIPISWSFTVLTGKKKDLTEIYQAYSIAVHIIVFFLPTAIIVYCLVRMFMVVNQFANADSVRGLQTGRSARPQAKAIFVFSALFLNVFVCWSPLVFIRLKMDVSPDFKPGRELLEILVLLRCFSSLFDPVICVWCKTDFKRAFKAIVCRLKPNRDLETHRLHRNTENIQQHQESAL